MKYFNGELIDPGHGTSLTPLGNLVRSLGHDILDRIETFTAEVARHQNPKELRVAILKSIWVAKNRWLDEEFRKRFPEGVIQPELIDGYRELAPDIAGGRFDVAVISYPPKVVRPLVSLPWMDEPMLLVVKAAAAAKQLPNVTTVTRREVVGLHKTFFTMRLNSPMRNAVNKYLAVHRFEVGRQEEVESVLEALPLVEQGAGISILPASALVEAIQRNSIKAFHLEPEIKRPLGLLYRDNTRKPEALKSFLACFGPSEMPKERNRAERQMSERSASH